MTITSEPVAEGHAHKPDRFVQFFTPYIVIMSSPEFSDDLSGSWTSHSSSSICTSLHSKYCLTTDDQTAAHVCTLCYDITIKSTLQQTSGETRPLTFSWFCEGCGLRDEAHRSRVPEEEGGESIPCASQRAIPAVAVSRDD